MRRILTLAACALLAACTTTSPKLAAAIERPPTSARVLALQPDVELGVITASGLTEARADWSNQARDNIAAQLRAALDAKGLKYSALDPNTAMNGHNGQLLRLHDQVGKSILLFNYGVYNLPTHKGSFDWTLGEGAKELATTYNADYALFLHAEGTYSSDSRKLVWLGAAMLGVSLPTGGQSMFASLVELKTGRIIWFNVANASPDADMRSPEGARRLIAEVLKTAPF